MTMTRGQMKKQITKAPGKRRKKLKSPKKYLGGLSAKDKAKRRKEIERNAKKSSRDSSAYKFATDFDKKGKRRKTKVSKHTKAFKRRFG